MAEEAAGLQRHLHITLDETLNAQAYQRRFRLSRNIRDVTVRVIDPPADNIVDIQMLFRGLRYLRKLKTLSFESRDETRPS